jgi:Tfp pilus assembly protein PilX
MKQRGLSLIVVLIVLLVMALAAAAMLRTTDTATLIVGNIGFQKTARASGDAGIERAILWLDQNLGSTLNADNAASGYWASARNGCDLTGTVTAATTDDMKWEGGGGACGMTAVTLPDESDGVADGYTVSYVINRICSDVGAPATAGVTCSREVTESAAGSSNIGGSYGNLPFGGTPQVYYRITVRIAGPRNTVRYVQAFVII